ncbi:MAG: CatA-like O-acetyltransferase [Desulfitobacteriaceae bacterium]
MEQNGKIKMPLSITVHDATTDGWHINTFLDCLQHDINHPEIWIK